jgi:hypothetical protein
MLTTKETVQYTNICSQATPKGNTHVVYGFAEGLETHLGMTRWYVQVQVWVQNPGPSANLYTKHALPFWAG